MTIVIVIMIALSIIIARVMIRITVIVTEIVIQVIKMIAIIVIIVIMLIMVILVTIVRIAILVIIITMVTIKIIEIVVIVVMMHFAFIWRPDSTMEMQALEVHGYGRAGDIALVCSSAGTVPHDMLTARQEFASITMQRAAPMAGRTARPDPASAVWGIYSPSWWPQRKRLRCLGLPCWMHDAKRQMRAGNSWIAGTLAIH